MPAWFLCFIVRFRAVRARPGRGPRTGSGLNALPRPGSALKKYRRKSAEVLREIMPMTNLDNQTIQLIFIAITALAVLMQAVILLAIFVSVRKTAKSVTEQVEELRNSVMPIIDTTRDLMNRVAPKVEATAADLAEIAHGLRAQTAQMESAANEIVDRVRRQTAGWTRCSPAFWTVWTGPAPMWPMR